jgi:transcriptional regulator with XRE-family HTH domain
MAPKKNDAMKPVGKKIREARLGKKLTLDNLANETGFSVDYIKQIESGKKIPPVGTLLQLSRALQIDSSFLLKEQKESLDKRVKAYTKRTDNYAYDTLTPGAENKHLKAFRVIIDAMSEHSGVGFRHEGEEFVYVLKGKIEVTVGEHVNKLGKDDSLHFNSGIQHNLRNTGQEKAELVVVIFNP